MGQQQLLLVILVTIIVGIATVVAINIFGTAATEANRDAVRQDILGAAAQAQAIWARPTMMGGIGQDFTNLTDIRRLNIPIGSGDEFTSGTGEIQNANGTYTISAGADGDELTITGIPTSGPPNIVLIMTLEEVTDGPDEWDFDWGDGT